MRQVSSEPWCANSMTMHLFVGEVRGSSLTDRGAGGMEGEGRGGREGRKPVAAGGVETLRYGALDIEECYRLTDSKGHNTADRRQTHAQDVLAQGVATYTPAVQYVYTPAVEQQCKHQHQKNIYTPESDHMHPSSRATIHIPHIQSVCIPINYTYPHKEA